MTRNLFAVRLFLAAAMAPKESPVEVTEDGSKCVTCGLYVSPAARLACGTCAS